MSPSTGKPGIYRIKTDGTNMKRLTTIDLTDYRGSPFASLHMTIKDNYIYYSPNNFSINKMYLNGTNKKTIYKSPTWISSFYVSGSYVYINNVTNRSYFPGSSYSIYKVSTSGSSKRCLSSTKSNYISDMIYYNGYIFYIYSNGNYNYLYRTNSDGKNKKCILKTSSYLNYNIYNNKIYYTCNKDIYDQSEITYLRSCSLSGTNKKILFHDSHFYVILVDEGIVYVSNLSEIKTYKLY